MTPRQTDGHRQQMDGLRFLAFLGVFLFHALGDAFGVGGLGVHLFFALSGFLITRILLLNETERLTRGLGVFYARRILRIFPLYYGMLAILAIRGQLAYPLWQFLYAQNFLSFSQGDLIEPKHFWTLCVEEQFYLTYPLILALIPRPLRLYGIVGLIAASMSTLAVMDYLYPTNPMSFVLLPCAAQYLLWGGLAGYLDLSDAGRKFPGTAVLATGAGLTVVTLLLGISDVDRLPAFMAPYRLLVGVTFALVVFGLWRTNCQPVIRLFGWAPVAYLGKISYGLYVYHLFCFHWCDRLQSLPIPGVGLLRHVPLAVPAFLLTMALAAVSWHLYESPINNVKRYFPYRRAAAKPLRASPSAPFVARGRVPSDSCGTVVPERTPR
jgi:peptidoglycan/LPS O-acetylase OafA/YrhL